MTSSSSRLSLAIANFVGYLIVVIVNILANSVPLGGMTTGELSDLYPNLFVPSGLTFSIWGVIYLLLGLFVVYGIVFSARTPSAEPGFVEKIALLFIVSCAANAGWIFAWQYRVVPLSLVCMTILLVSLILMYHRLNIGRTTAGSPEKFLVHLPMSIYLGWISIATIANVTAVLVFYKWNRLGMGEQLWAILMICVGVFLGLVVLFSRKDIFYALVIDWAVLGILLKRLAVDRNETQAIILVSIVGLCLLTLGIVIQLARGRVYR